MISASAIDYTGLSIIIPVVVAAIVSLGTFAMQAIAWRDHRAMKLAQDALWLASEARDLKAEKRDEHIASLNTKADELAVKLDGQGEALNVAIAKGAFAEGKAAGIDQARDNPQVPAAAQGGSTKGQTP